MHLFILGSIYLSMILLPTFSLVESSNNSYVLSPLLFFVMALCAVCGQQFCPRLLFLFPRLFDRRGSGCQVLFQRPALMTIRDVHCTSICRVASPACTRRGFMLCPAHQSHFFLQFPQRILSAPYWISEEAVPAAQNVVG